METVTIVRENESRVIYGIFKNHSDAIEFAELQEYVPLHLFEYKGKRMDTYIQRETREIWTLDQVEVR